MIDTKTKLLGVIGTPISHSLSPTLHNFIIQKFGLNYCYHAFDVTPQDLGNVIAGFNALKFVGINVTIPHKQQVIKYLDEVSDEAQNLGAVNTIHFRNGKMYGYNTDVIGFLKSLGSFRQKLNRGVAIVLGAGGSARAVIYALIKAGIGEIKIYNRTLANGRKLVEFMKVRCRFQKLSAYTLSQADLSNDLKKADIIVNTTPVGMVPNIAESPLAEHVSIPAGIPVVDLIYNPLETKLLKNANEVGANTISGLDMLIYQGLESFQIWTGQTFDEEMLLPELRGCLLEKLHN